VTHFMSIGMILTYPEHQYLTAMDLLAKGIADSELDAPEHHALIAFMFKPHSGGGA
jgi:nitrate reductase assembly molybdenum cofactor insertion protein NarJ